MAISSAIASCHRPSRWPANLQFEPVTFLEWHLIHLITASFIVFNNSIALFSDLSLVLTEFALFYASLTQIAQDGSMSLIAVLTFDSLGLQSSGRRNSASTQINPWTIVFLSFFQCYAVTILTHFSIISVIGEHHALDVDPRLHGTVINHNYLCESSVLYVAETLLTRFFFTVFEHC